ncbi:MAG TPA: GTP-binding protein [Flavobacterium sp.]|nr:GTP-binding protein [Flavobacterium sp.]HAT76882.1 GTP-binding protein [Flavobacterium sp.]HAT81290.1 GTP-binding protein [Flavobacterium sp.]
MENQDLLHVSPDVQEKIEKLITENDHFAALFEEYLKVKHEVSLIKTDEVVTTDEHLKELKVKILHLKDEIYSILRR